MRPDDCRGCCIDCIAECSGPSAGTFRGERQLLAEPHSHKHDAADARDSVWTPSSEFTILLLILFRGILLVLDSSIAACMAPRIGSEHGTVWPAVSGSCLISQRIHSTQVAAFVKDWSFSFSRFFS